ncbi:MarR family protein [compost metagenome]
MERQRGNMDHPHDELLLREVFETFTQFAKKIVQEDDEEKAWMLAQTSDLAVKAVMQQMTLMMVHVLDAIGKFNRVNGTVLSSRFGIPKGTVSKLARRLEELGLITFETIPGNKKELHFAITPLGETIYKIHERLDQRILEGATRFMADYSEEQLKFIRDFMSKLISHSFLQDVPLKEMKNGFTPEV